MLKYLQGKDAATLERHVGYHNGRLSQGFQIYALAAGEVLLPEDFELGASTRWSGGTITSEDGGAVLATNIGELLEARGQNIGALKAKVASFFATGGGNRPAKVLARWRHEPWMRYPDARVLDGLSRSGVPQFKLLRSRRFVCVGP